MGKVIINNVGELNQYLKTVYGLELYDTNDYVRSAFYFKKYTADIFFKITDITPFGRISNYTAQINFDSLLDNGHNLEIITLPQDSEKLIEAIKQTLDQNKKYMDLTKLLPVPDHTFKYNLVYQTKDLAEKMALLTTLKEVLGYQPEYLTTDCIYGGSKIVTHSGLFHCTDSDAYLKDSDYTVVSDGPELLKKAEERK